MSYKPLPEEVEIRDSGIEGKGLFAKVIIEEGTNLGMTHVSNPDFEDGRIRTPLGGFINHSEEPNCYLALSQDWDDYKVYNLVTLHKIEEGEEIVLDYDM